MSWESALYFRDQITVKIRWDRRERRQQNQKGVTPYKTWNCFKGVGWFCCFLWISPQKSTIWEDNISAFDVSPLAEIGLREIFPWLDDPAIRVNYIGGGFKYFFLFIPTWGENPIWHNLTNIFQGGWFNHQPDKLANIFLPPLWEVRLSTGDHDGSFHGFQLSGMLHLRGCRRSARTFGGFAQWVSKGAKIGHVE